MRSVIIEIVCDVCSTISLTEDDVHPIEFTIAGVSYEQDRCIDCTDDLIAQSLRTGKAKRKQGKDAARPFPCNYNGCDFAGKTERGLSTHQTRAGHRSD